ncbi:MAG: hypothetical protein ACTSR8_22205 [Promethearchaeota archaeon]
MGSRKKHYKNEGLIKFLVIIAGIIALAWVLSGLIGLFGYGYYYAPVFVSPYWMGYTIQRIIFLIVGLIVAIFTIICGIQKPSKKGGLIVPFEWWMFLVLAILVIVFGGGLIACILLIIAFLIALIEEL